MKTKIIISLLVLLIAIQFIKIDRSVPENFQDYDFLVYNQTNAEITTLLKSACYDCHSYETKYPWYSQIAPVSWYLKRHINEGREHLNFSDWKYLSEEKRAHKIDECIELIEEDEMPLFSYSLIHKEAKLSEEQKEQLVEFFKAL
ncbi:MAG: heme-binding domain-containing protein [Chitinophagales bacterium]|nr:heme-binding domain-containing protein [Bacteroidota bacterium]MCB9256919.1 heme-binding domain-containing protein [Chitinophagales bacterium]